MDVFTKAQDPTPLSKSCARMVGGIGVDEEDKLNGAPAQTGFALAIAVTPVGFGLTVTVLVATAVQAPGLVTVTVYVVVLPGFTEMDWVVSVVLHDHEVPVPPDSINETAGSLVHFDDGPEMAATEGVIVMVIRLE